MLVVAPITVGISVVVMLARPTTLRALMARGALDVQPFPGTPDVSPQADIGFPALAPRQIEKLTVTGSRSGPHRGRLSPLPGGHGVSFEPLHAFTEGERVFVRATLTSPAGGTAPDTPRATDLSFAFTVAVPPSRRRHTAPRASLRSRHRRKRARDSRLNARTQRFHSEPWLRPPLVRVSGKDPDPGEGDIFADAQDNIESGPMILNPQGKLIYFGALRSFGAFNVEVQRYRGQSALTYWQGVGIDPGHGVILNHHYQQIATVYAGNGYGADAHEFQITPQGDALMTVYAPVRADLSSIGGPRHGILVDSIIQEVNIATGKVVWEWHASGHVPLSQTHAGRPGPWPYDFFHINSIQQLPDGNLLVSGRNTWTIYEISRRTGRILWEIGGDSVVVCDGRRNQLRVAARRPDASKRHCHGLRQRLRGWIPG